MNDGGDIKIITKLGWVKDTKGAESLAVIHGVEQQPGDQRDGRSNPSQHSKKPNDASGYYSRVWLVHLILMPHLHPIRSLLGLPKLHRRCWTGKASQTTMAREIATGDF